MIRIGYACQTIGIPGTDYRSCIARSANEPLLRELIAHNLRSLENAIRYNLKAGILLFRISSDLIPFGSSPVNALRWHEIFAEDFARIGRLISDGNMRVSMHPGQYTVLNSPRPDVVERALADLDYHDKILGSMGLDPSHKIILHVGGLYQDKAAAINRFIEVWHTLPESIRARLVLENDDRSYSIDEVLKICEACRIPAVFDNLHHEINPDPQKIDAAIWVERCRSTWLAADGPQKVHYSQQDPGKNGGAHSATIAVAPFVEYCRSLHREDLDIMLEVKDKNLSAVKCRLALQPSIRRPALEAEWARYKYSVLEHDPAAYLAIRHLFSQPGPLSAVEFFSLIEQAMAKPVDPGHAVNAASHVWGYFKEKASSQEKNDAQRLIARCGQDAAYSSAKKFLLKLVLKYDDAYLKNSLYFYL